VTVRRLLVMAIVLGSLLAACSSSKTGGSSTGTAASGPPFTLSGTPVSTTTVTLPKSYRFEPQIIKVAAGSTVTWTNHDNFIHSVKFLTGSNFFANLEIGKSASTRFDTPGTYYYECSYHPSQMHGEVVVE